MAMYETDFGTEMYSVFRRKLLEAASEITSYHGPTCILAGQLGFFLIDDTQTHHSLGEQSIKPYLQKCSKFLEVFEKK